MSAYLEQLISAANITLLQRLNVLQPVEHAMSSIPAAFCYDGVINGVVAAAATCRINHALQLVRFYCPHPVQAQGLIVAAAFHNHWLGAEFNHFELYSHLRSGFGTEMLDVAASLANAIVAEDHVVAIPTPAIKAMYYEIVNAGLMFVDQGTYRQRAEAAIGYHTTLWAASGVDLSNKTDDEWAAMVDEAIALYHVDNFPRTTRSGDGFSSIITKPHDMCSTEHITKYHQQLTNMRELFIDTCKDAFTQSK